MTPKERKAFEYVRDEIHGEPDGSLINEGTKEQEPVAWADHGVVNWIADKQFRHAALLYEAPQRTWVGLTDEEIKEIHHQSFGKDIATATGLTEAKLKEKNT